jgi:hypothetical protein
MQHEELLHHQDVSFLQLLARKCMKNETNWTGMTMRRGFHFYHLTRENIALRVEPRLV